MTNSELQKEIKGMKDSYDMLVSVLNNKKSHDVPSEITKETFKEIKDELKDMKKNDSLYQGKVISMKADMEHVLKGIKDIADGLVGAATKEELKTLEERVGEKIQPIQRDIRWITRIIIGAVISAVLGVIIGPKIITGLVATTDLLINIV